MRHMSFQKGHSCRISEDLCVPPNQKSFKLKEPPKSLSVTSCLQGYLQAETTHPCSVLCTVTNSSSLPIRYIRRNNAKLAQIAVRKVIPGRGPGDDGRRAGRLEGVDALAGLAVITLDAGALVAAANHVVAIPGEACKSQKRQHQSCAAVSPGCRDNLLRLLTGPTMSVNDRWQIQSWVSQRQIMESVPPEAR